MSDPERPDRADGPDAPDPSDQTGDMLGALNQTAFLAASGLVLDEASGERVVGHIDLGPEHHQPFGIVHGGVYATAVESAGSIGASLAVRDRGQVVVGVNNNTHFLASMSEGRVEVLATPIAQGRTQQLWNVEITRTGDGRLVATGQLRLQNVEPRP